MKEMTSGKANGVHLCELVNRHQQKNGVWAGCNQRHHSLRLLPHALLHLAAAPVPSRRLHHRHAPALGNARSQLAAPGGIVGGRGQLAQDVVGRGRLPTPDVPQEDKSQLRGRGPVVPPCEEFTHSWKERNKGGRREG